MKETAVELLADEPQRKKKKEFDDKCKKVTEVRDKASLKVIQNSSEENKITLALKQREVKKNIRINRR